ncbi:MAG: hypothetical protein K8R25_00110 [Methanosarcinales archaeon]|nr:hypothetical protein [Methanosarcinales archaeon]
MKIKVILPVFLLGLIFLLTFTAIATAEPPQNDPTIQMLKKEAIGQVNESKKFTIGPDSKLGEIPWDFPSLKKRCAVSCCIYSQFANYSEYALFRRSHTTRSYSEMLSI